jgi:hypothetical protein
VNLTAGGDAFNPASAETTITVREYRQPRGTVEANPAQIKAGDKSTVSSNFQGQCGGPIQAATYEASEGTMQGDQFDSSSIQWDTSNNAEQKKSVTITAKAADNRSTRFRHSRRSKWFAPRWRVMPVRLPDVLFSAGSSRVNNCGKQFCAEQVRYYERIIGHGCSGGPFVQRRDERETGGGTRFQCSSGYHGRNGRLPVDSTDPSASEFAWRRAEWRIV